jgi:hypothetical protein
MHLRRCQTVPVKYHTIAEETLLGFQECSANRIALVVDDDVQYMIIQEENSAYVAYTSLLSTQNTLILTNLRSLGALFPTLGLR